MFFYSRDPRFLRQAATFEAKDRSSYLDRISLSHSNCHINFKFRFEFENSASMWNVVVCRELLETRHKWGEQVEIVALFVLFVLPCFFSKYFFFNCKKMNSLQQTQKRYQ